MTETPVLYTMDNGVAMLMLNRPEKRNALNQAMVAGLKEGLDRAAADPDVRVVAIQGRGTDFCSGADLAELGQIATMGEAENLADARALGDLFVKIRGHPKPVLSLVKGRALAGGCGLATACDVVLARDDAEFGYPEIHLAFVPAMVMAILRRKVPEALAFELVVGGARIDAHEAQRVGLVTRVFPAFTFASNVKDYLGELVKRSPEAVTLTKRLLYELGDLNFVDGVARGAQVNVEVRMSEPCREGVRRFLEKTKEP